MITLARMRAAPFLCWVLAVAACARAQDAGDAGRTDAAPPSDAPADAPVDAPAPPVDASPPDAARPDARPDAPPDACVATWTPLLSNAAFDLGDTQWLSSGSVITDASMMPIAPQSPSYAAWLAGYNGADEYLAQTVTVPGGATALRLRTYRCFVTSDVSGADDHLSIELRDASGATVLETLGSYSNLDVGTVCSWGTLVLHAASAHAGESIRLHFHATTDALYPTSYYVDTLALEARACP